MTISLGWVRRNKAALELIVASDSRLRSRGALDQAQKIYRLQRGDCCLAFSGDAQIAYPLFMQVGSAADNYIRTRSRATDVTDMAPQIESILNNLVASWNIPSDAKEEELSTTRVLFAGWSWRYRRFEIGFFLYRDGRFGFHHRRVRLPHPWAENNHSLVFLGDYYRDYLRSLEAVLIDIHGTQPKNKNVKKMIDFDYEPIQALQSLLNCKDENDLPAIGGAPQMVKLYPFGNNLPIVIRTAGDQHYLLGRRLFDWEKTEYPILDMTKKVPNFLYPMSEIPVPARIGPQAPGEEDIAPV
jgi:hypothetical protein